MTQPLDIAIIGLSGSYAGAADARRFWQNILDKVDAVTEADAEWTGPFLDPEHYADRNDRIYTNRGGFLKELAQINPLDYGVMPSQTDGGEPDHLLALKHAGDALADAGYRQRDFDRSRAGVVLGRGTYTNRGQANVLAHAFFLDQLMDVVGGLRPDFTPAELLALRAGLKQQLPHYSGELVAQLTPNVITGLICNRLDLMGPNYIVDAACASTLMAFDQAVRELTSGRSDLMLAGGVQASVPAQLYVQFSQIKALSRGQLRPFEKGNSGTLLGEGVGVMVLKRLADAERDGDRIYAVVKGIGVSSDGKAKGLLTPRPEGEVLAVRRAYESSGIDPDTIDLIEAHGTGTDIGDRTEIETLAKVYGGRGVGPKIAVGSVKSMIGHCLPASGSASLIKMALALHHKILPPTLCGEVDPDLQIEKTPLYINTETRPWIHGKAHPRRAAVNAFGFGGINGHVILEEYVGPQKTQVQVLHRPSPTELVTLAADSRELLVSLVEAALKRLRAEAPATLSQIAKASSTHARGVHRLAIVADNEADLIKKLEQALDKLGRAEAKPFKTRSGLFYGHGEAPGKVCFLYPGEGAQYPDMLADLCLHFPQVRDWFDFIDATALRSGIEPRSPVLFPPSSLGEEARRTLEARLYEVDIAAESVFAASMGLQTLLESLDIKPDAMLGHSTGENTALVTCGVRRFEQRDDIADAIRELNRLFRRLEQQGRIVEGTLLTVGALRPEQRAELLADPGELQVAMDNCPNQLVLFGPAEAAAALKQRLSGEGAICLELPFGRAYHTPLFKPMADGYREHLLAADIGPGDCTLYSARSVDTFPRQPDAIRELAAQQWENPVRFTETLERLYEDGYRVFVEVGPAGNLTSFVGDTLRGRDDVVAVASNSRRKPGIQQLHTALAQLFTAGVAFHPAALYAHRDIADLDLLKASSERKRRTQTLNLQMPAMRLTEAMREQFAMKAAVNPPLPRAPEPGALAPAEARADSRPLSPSPAPAGVSGQIQVDPRVQAVQAHFALMNEFLGSQARMLGLAAAVPANAITLPSLATAPAMAPMLPQIFATPKHAFPLLGDISEHSAERLVALRKFDVGRDVFLQDHSIGGAPSPRQPQLRGLMVMPFTFSMELVAQAALALIGEPLKIIGLSELRGHRWLALDDGTLELRTVAERVPAAGEASAAVRVRVFLLGRGGPLPGVLVFEGHADLAPSRAIAPAPIAWPSRSQYPPVFSTPERLYGEGLFHGPRLQGVQRIRRWAPEGIEADLRVLPSDDYFADAPGARLLTDAALIDAVGQLAGYWLFEQYGSQFYCFPFRVGRYRQFVDVLPVGTPLICRGAIRLIGDQRLEAQFDVMDEQGRLLLRLEEWEDRKFEIPPVFHRFHKYPAQEFVSTAGHTAVAGVLLRRVEAFPEQFLDTGFEIWKRGLAHAALGERERTLFLALPNSAHRREEWLLGRIAAKDAVRQWARREHGLELAPADIEVLPDELGAPRVHCALLPRAPSVSISHSHRHAAALAAEPDAQIGMDLQFHNRVRADDLAAVALTADEARAVNEAPESDRARIASAFWSAKEAAAKALGRGLGGRPQDYHVVAWQFDRRGGTTFADVTHGSQRMRVELQFDEDSTLAVCRIAVPLERISPALSLQSA